MRGERRRLALRLPGVKLRGMALDGNPVIDPKDCAVQFEGLKLADDSNCLVVQRMSAEKVERELGSG